MVIEDNFSAFTIGCFSIYNLVRNADFLAVPELQIRGGLRIIQR